MSDNETEDRPAEVRIPSHWRAMPALAEACQMLEANPDLIGEDVALALESEAPDAIKFLDAMVAACQHARLTVQCDIAYAALLPQRIARSERIWEERKALTLKVMQQLRLKTHNAPAGTASRSAVPASVIITNEDLVPDKFWVTVPATKRIDKRLVSEELKAKREVPGALLSNGGITLRIQ